MSNKNEIDNLLKRAKQIQQIRVDEASEESAKKAVINAIKMVPESSMSKRVFYLTNFWRKNMRNKLLKVSVAAIALVVVFVGVSHFGGGIYGTTPMFADVLEQISSARTVQYCEVFNPGAEDEFTVHEMVREPGLMRSEIGTGGNITSISVRDFATGLTLQMRPESKKAFLVKRIGRSKAKRPFNYLKWIAELHEKEGEFIGEEELAGKLTYLFVIKHPFERTTVWVDPKTNLPIRVEEVDFPNPDQDIVMPKLSLNAGDFGGDPDNEVIFSLGSGRGNDQGIQQSMKIIKTEFVWNAPLDESLFRLEAPQGYTVEEKKLDVSKPGEPQLRTALNFWQEMSSGEFPLDINDFCDSDKVSSMLIKKFDRDGDPQTEFDQALQLMNEILGAAYFAQTKKVDGTWGYAGATVRYGDKRPLCWWKSEDTDDFRVIYGDLSVGDISPDKLPQ